MLCMAKFLGGAVTGYFLETVALDRRLVGERLGPRLCGSLLKGAKSKMGSVRHWIPLCSPVGHVAR